MTIYVTGMHGMGDNLHQRAVLRQLMVREPVFLETPWPCIYEDMVGPRLTLLNKNTILRTQLKNAKREAAKYSLVRIPVGARPLRISYSPQQVRDAGSVLAAMCGVAGVDYTSADFRLPVPDDWCARARVWTERWRPTKPLMIYRPLNERTEWKGCPVRNPDHRHYADLFRAIRDRYFVISVADVQPKAEWLVGEQVQADATCHAGELDFETLAALTYSAELVFTSPGFAVILAQAVGTAAVCVFGGYEDSRSFTGGARFSPYLGIDPIHPCQCFSHTHACRKQIDMPNALRRLTEFCDENESTDGRDSSAEGGSPAVPPAVLQSA